MNPFAETGLLETDVLESPDVSRQNPYASPVTGGRGFYDWTLAKQAMAWVAAIAISYLLIGAIASWSEFRRDPNHCREPVLNTMIEFATNWRESNGLE